MKTESVRIRRTLAVVGMVAAALAVPAAQAGGDPAASLPLAGSAEALNETPQAWFVELTRKPSRKGTSISLLKAEKEAFRAAAMAAGVEYAERFAFDTLWNGLSVSVSRSGAGQLARLPGVTAVYPVVSVSLPPGQPEAATDPDLASAIAMTGADVAQNELGLTGAGVKVAVLDTGTDFHNPDLGGCFGAGCRVVTGYDFVGDSFDANPANPTYQPVPHPDANPDDCNGHGTHVSGIVGAKSAGPTGVTGVAPGVSFGAYRVFGCEGSTSADVLIAAMERVLEDGMDVLNMSIGASFVNFFQYPTAKAADELADAGVVVVASIGNSGANGLYAAGAPGVGLNVIGTASFENTLVAQNAFSISPDGRLVGYNPASGSPAPPKSGSLPMARTGTASSAADACAALPAGSLAGKAALIRRGTCGFYNKALNAQIAGAAAVVLYNNAIGFVSPTVAGAPAITIPVVMAGKSDGELIDSRLAAGPVSMSWTATTASSSNPTAGQISAFSSFGPGAELLLKPDLGAPGGSIWSTYPVEKGGHASLSGTSMSSPYVAGAAALLLEARPAVPAGLVRTLLQNSADPKAKTAPAGVDNVHRQGAGLLDVDDSILATTTVNPSKVSLGEGSGGSFTLQIANGGPAPVTYGVSSLDALATGPNTFVPAFVAAASTVAFTASSVTVPAGGTAALGVTVGASPALADKSLYGGYVVLTPAAGGQTYRVPYAGFKGDYQSIQALAPTPFGFPWLARIVGPNLVNQPAGATYSLAGGDSPVIVYHLDHQVRKLTVKVVEASSGKPVHPAFSNVGEQELLPRNSASTSFFTLTWDGRRLHDNGRGNGDHLKAVPNGTYKLILTALKAGGDPANPAHTETWTSPAITLARP
ncbi:MAG: S8 family serine peptidase [Gaiellaceae bacterium]